jgi:hypothetical protein
MLGAYGVSSGALIHAVWVHLTTLDLSVVKCTLVHHSGISSTVVVYEDFGSGRVIPLFQGLCSADDSSPLIGDVVGAKRGFVLVPILPKINGRG